MMETIEQIKKEVKYLMEESSCHDWDHVLRVYKLACHIGEILDADMEILKLAALLHDIGREEELKSKKKFCHAEIGAIMAEGILLNYGYSPETISKIVHCIKCHRFRKGNTPESLEAKILYDSDKIDNIGAIGIGRAFHFAGAHSGKVHNTPGVDVVNSEELGREDTAYREFLIKLSKIKDKMFTEEGKRIAEDRHKFMVEFFDKIERECLGEI